MLESARTYPLKYLLRKSKVGLDRRFAIAKDLTLGSEGQLNAVLEFKEQNAIKSPEGDIVQMYTFKIKELSIIKRE